MTAPQWLKDVVYRISFLGVTVVQLFLWRIRSTKEAPLPRNGPYLIIPNHSSMLDPVFATYPTFRLVRYMASAALFRIPFVGRLVDWYGAFPKERYVKDRGAAARMQELWDRGYPIMIFPEGLRSWDGSPRPFVPGISRLIRRFDATVVCARMRTAHMFHPRWATYPRWVAIRLDYSAPMRFDDGISDEEIERTLADFLRIDPEEIEAPGLSLGWRMAHGLPQYLWACPRCMALDALSLHPTDGDRVDCTHCAGAWRIDVSTRLHPVGDGPTHTVATHYRRIREHFGDRPCTDPVAFERESLLLTASHVHVRVPTGAGKADEPLVEGPARLYTDRLEIDRDGDDDTWVLSFDEVQAVMVEVAAELFIRKHDHSKLVLNPEGDSTIKWEYFWQQHLEEHQRRVEESASTQG